MGRGRGRSGALRLVMGLLIGLALVGGARAADQREFIHETQQSTTVAQQLTLIWWIPVEFWDLSLANNPSVPPQAIEEVRKVFGDYQVFGVLRATTGLQGLSNVATRADLVGNARLEIDGKVISPLDGDKVPPGVQAMLGAMRPMLSGMLGQLGQSMELVVYPATVDGQRINDPRKPGAFQYGLYDQTFKWRLPLASMMPKKIDPKTKEEFPGNYDYNPYTGGRLSAK